MRFLCFFTLLPISALANNLNLDIKVSTLGRGLSSGLEIEYSDPETIKNALSGRFTKKEAPVKELRDKHGISEAIEAVFFFHGRSIRAQQKIRVPDKSADKHEKS